MINQLSQKISLTKYSLLPLSLSLQKKIKKIATILMMYFIIVSIDIIK